MKILVTCLPDLKKINLQRPHQIVKYLSDRHDVTIIGVNANIQNPINDPLVENYLQNVDYYYLSQQPTNSIFQEFQILKKIQNISDRKNRFDIHLNLHSILSCYLIQKKFMIPTVMDIYDDIIGWISHSPQINPIIRPFVTPISKHLLLTNIQNSDKVIFSVNSLQNLYGISDNKSKIIPNGVDVDFFAPKDIINEKVFEKNLLFFTLGFVGYLGDWVDFTPVFTAASQLKATIKLKIIIVGDGPNLEKCKRMVKEFDLSDNVTFTGNISYSEIPRYIAQMDVCILPFNDSSVSQHALPLKLFEYMASKKPVISSAIEAVEKTIGKKVLYYSDSNEFRTCLELLYYNTKMSEDLSIQGMKFVRDEYSWSSILNSYEKVLIDVYNQRVQ